MGRMNPYIRGLVEEGLPSVWKRDSDRMAEQFNTHATVDSEGVVRWTESQNFPPSDVLEFWKYLNKPFNYEKTLESKKIDDDKFFDEYFKRQANRKLSDEERFEMASAFGKGATVVDIITGQTFKL